MKSLFTILCMLSAFYSQNYAQKWELRKNENGIKVYSRIHIDTKASEFKAETVLNVSSEILVQILREAENYKKWMADLKYAKRIKTIHENKWYAYYIAEVPWPLEDRDIIYLVNLKEENGKTTLRLKSEPDFLIKSKNCVRMNIASGEWVFTVIGENKTHVFYRMYAEPQINVPTWIMNLFIVDGPYETLRDLRTYAEIKASKEN